jgi:hypothetical protein
MRKLCSVCGGQHFANTEYRYARGVDPVPALECADCRAIVLDEALASSDQERHSVRLAAGVRSALVAARSSASAAWAPDEWPTPPLTID